MQQPKYMREIGIASCQKSAVTFSARRGLD